MFYQSCLSRWKHMQEGEKRWGYFAHFQIQLLKLTLRNSKLKKERHCAQKSVKRFCTTGSLLIGARDIKYFCQHHWRSHSTPCGWLFESAQHLAEAKMPNRLFTSYKERNIKRNRKHHHTISVKLLCDHILILCSALITLYFCTPTTLKK